MTTMQRLVGKNYVSTIANNNIVTGIGLGLVSSYVPFAAAFALARVAQLTAQSCAGYSFEIAGVGLAAVILSGGAVYAYRNSVKSMLGIAVVTFAILGLLVSSLV